MVSVDEQHHIYRTSQGIKSYEMVGALIGEDFASFVDYFDHQHPPTSTPPHPNQPTCIRTRKKRYNSQPLISD